MNVCVVAGMFVLAYLVARWLTDTFGTGYQQDPVSDAFDYGYENDAIPDWDHIPTDAEWREWQQMLDDEAQDGEDYR